MSPSAPDHPCRRTIHAHHVDLDSETRPVHRTGKLNHPQPPHQPFRTTVCEELGNRPDISKTSRADTCGDVEAFGLRRAVHDAGGLQACVQGLHRARDYSLPFD